MEVFTFLVITDSSKIFHIEKKMLLYIQKKCSYCVLYCAKKPQNSLSWQHKNDRTNCMCMFHRYYE